MRVARRAVLAIAFVCGLSACKRNEPAGVLTEPAPSVETQAGSPGLDVQVSLIDAGLAVDVRGKRLAADCRSGSATTAAPTLPVRMDGGIDAAGLTRCARTVKRALGKPDETRVSLTATEDRSYRDLVIVMDALRSDSNGDLFPEPRLVAPVGAVVHGSARSRFATGAPSRTPPGEPENALAIVISKTRIIVGLETVLRYDSSTPLRAGLPTSAKRDGFYVVPLGEALNRHRGQAKHADEVIVIADAETPYRVLFEVLFTAGEVGISTHRLLVQPKAGERPPEPTRAR